MDLELQLSSKLIWYVLPETLLTKSDETIKFLQVLHLLSVHLKVPFFIVRGGNLALTNVSLRVLQFRKQIKGFASKTVLYLLYYHGSKKLQRTIKSVKNKQKIFTKYLHS